MTMSKRKLTQLTLCTALATGALACAPADDALPEGDLDGLDPISSPAVSDATEVTPEGVLPFTGHVEAETYREITTWFVELAHEPLVMGGDPAELDADLEGLRRQAFERALPLDERFVFRGIVNGVTVRMGIDEVPVLARLQGVRRIYPVGITTMPEPQHVSEPQLGTALGMTGADMVQRELGFDGTGIKVGVIDSGIDLQHPDLAPRIIGGFDFVGDAYNSRTPGSLPVPEPGPGSRPGGDDCGGHGTHVAGIIGASGNPETGGARGVAPGVGLAAYRVFGCSGSTDDDVIVAAIERAYEDGMDLINLSLGSDNGFPEDFLSMALSRVLELGMVPVSAAGNNGRNGTFTAGSPAVGADVISVASFDNLFSRVAKVQLSTGVDVGYTVLTGAPALPTSGESAAITYVGRGCNADTYTSDPRGKVALITRGECAFAEKYDRAYAAGAVGVVIENNVPGTLNGTLGGTRTQGWGIGISQENGTLLKAALAQGTVTLRFTGGFLVEPLPNGGLASDFSSYGLAPDLSLKPDIAAPGGFIRSTYPLEKPGESPGYAVLGGTSMASPYVAGAVALLMQARPDLPAWQVRTVLQNSAEPKPWWGDRNGPALDSVHRQGAGMVRIDRAILGT
jgi:minor extracellular serine protease Vpr